MRNISKVSLGLMLLGALALGLSACAEGGAKKKKHKYTGSYELYIAKNFQGKDQKLCGETKGRIPGSQMAAFIAAQKKLIKYPGGNPGNVSKGNSKRGEKVYTNKKKGNCVACHCGHPKPELVACGNMGVSHRGYAKLGNTKKHTYDYIYNSWAKLPCSDMIRAGVHKLIKPQDAADITAYLHDKNSSMNTGVYKK